MGRLVCCVVGFCMLRCAREQGRIHLWWYPFIIIDERVSGGGRCGAAPLAFPFHVLCRQLRRHEIILRASWFRPAHTPIRPAYGKRFAWLGLSLLGAGWWLYGLCGVCVLLQMDARSAALVVTALCVGAERNFSENGSVRGAGVGL